MSRADGTLIIAVVIVLFFFLPPGGEFFLMVLRRLSIAGVAALGVLITLLLFKRFAR